MFHVEHQRDVDERPPVQRLRLMSCRMFHVEPSDRGTPVIHPLGKTVRYPATLSVLWCAAPRA